MAAFALGFALTALAFGNAIARAEPPLASAVREVIARLDAGEVERAHRLALAIPEPREARARFAVGHLHQKVASAMERMRGPSLRRFHLPPGSPPQEDRCDPRRAAWWRSVAEHRRRFERLVPPARVHGRGTVIADLAHDLGCAGDLRAARAELVRWRSDGASWQRGWYAWLDGDPARAAAELRDPALDRLIDGVALARTRVMLAALGRDEPRRKALCTSGPPAGVPALVCRSKTPALSRLEGRLLLPRGATAEVLLFPLGFENTAIASDPYRVYRNLSFFHQRAPVRADGRFLFPRIVPGSYQLLPKVFSELPLLSTKSIAVELRPGERQRLGAIPIRSAGSTGSRSR